MFLAKQFRVCWPYLYLRLFLFENNHHKICYLLDEKQPLEVILTAIKQEAIGKVTDENSGLW